MSMLILLTVLLQSSAHVLSDAQIQAAIAAGLAKPTIRAVVDIGAGQYQIMLQGPTLRITGSAAEAASKFMPFTLADVTAEMRDPRITVVIYPNPPQFIAYAGWQVPEPVTHVVIRAKDGTVAQPERFEMFPVEWSNAVGGTFASRGGTATFAQLPAGELEVIAVTSQALKPRTLKAKDRERLK